MLGKKILPFKINTLLCNMSYYIHDVPGRLRIKSPKLKYRPERCAAIQLKLKSINGVTTTKVNATTGSVTINYNRKELSSNYLLNVLVREKALKISKVTKEDPFIRSVASEAGEKVGKAILSYTVEQAFRSNGLSLLTALI